MRDYKAVCTIADVEDFGVNFYSGTIVIDGNTHPWSATDDPERRKYMGRLKVDGVSIRRRKDYNAIHGAVTEAIRETVKLIYPPQEQQQPQPQPSEPSEQHISDEDDGLSMEEILGGGQQQREQEDISLEDVLGPRGRNVA
jgi:hypothetical protein